MSSCCDMKSSLLKGLLLVAVGKALLHLLQDLQQALVPAAEAAANAVQILEVFTSCCSQKPSWSRTSRFLKKSSELNMCP